MVQGNSFHKLLEKPDLCYQLPSQKTLSDKVIPALYNNVKDIKVLPGIKDAKFVAFTSDCWKSKVNQSYISITVYI